MTREPGPTRDVDLPSEVRCTCHRLLARIEDGAVILRCPRCKKRAVVSLADPARLRDLEVEFRS